MNLRRLVPPHVKAAQRQALEHLECALARAIPQGCMGVHMQLCGLSSGRLWLSPWLCTMY